MTPKIKDIQFVEGHVYSRATDIHDRLGGSRQSGIAPSSTCPAIFIFTSDEGEQFGYVDNWDQAQQVYTYTGEGQIGTMTYDGRSLHLFKKVSRAGGKYMYSGEMQCAATQTLRGLDRDGNERDVIQFQLVRLRAITDAGESQSADPQVDASLIELRKRAYAATKSAGSKKKDAVRSVYERSKDMTTYALKRAAGQCESCDKPAPFLKLSGEPYLEVHHTDRVSDGGLDAPDRVGAICPTCHRRIHHGTDGELLNEKLRIKITQVEARLCTRGR